MGTEPGVRTWLAMLPMVVMAVVAAVDALAGPQVGFLPLLSLGPGLAAVSLRPAQTVLMGGLAVVLSLLLAAYDHLLGSQWLIALATIAGVTTAGVIASAGRQRKERELANVRAVAEVAQRVLLRPMPTGAGQVDVAVRYISAAAAARIGGDLYEVIAAEDHVRLIVADVQGKGLPAVQTASVVLGAFREAAYDAPDLAAIAAQIELSLARQTSEDEFVTAVLAQIAASGAIEILNCGHPPPLLLSGGSVRFAEPPEADLPLGLTGLATAMRKPSVFPLRPGDLVLFYTDGISEARDKSGNFYSLDRCGAMVDGLEPGAALDRLCRDVMRHVGHELHDDAAMLLIGPREQQPPAAAPDDPRGSDTHAPAAAVTDEAARG